MVLGDAHSLLYANIGVVVHIKTIQFIPQALVFGFKGLVAFVEL